MCRIEEYYKKMEETYDAGKMSIYSNTDRSHNAAIMLLMLKKALKISIFCGSLSFLCKDFYEDIENNSPEDAQFLKEKIRDAWSQFIAKSDSKIDIILENKRDFSQEELIIPIEKLRNEKVEITYLPKNVKNKDKIKHFSFTEDNRIVRIEIDKENHQALCKIGDGVSDSTSKIARENFRKLYDLSEKLTA